METSRDGNVRDARGCTLERTSVKKIEGAEIEMVGESQALARIQLGEAKRRYPSHFISKLSDSDGEQNETRHWLKSAMQCKYITSDSYKTLLAKCKIIGRMLGNMMHNPENWVPKNRH